MEVKITDNLDYVDEIVEIHLSTFDGFFLTFLGKEFLRLLYSGFIQHEKSNLIIAIEDNEIVGFLAYSEDMSSFYKYLIKSKLFSFAWCAFKAFIRRPSIMFRLLSAFGKSEETNRKEKYIELASIGVKVNQKGKGVGTKLIEYLKLIVNLNIFDYISLETDAENNEYTNKFYKKNNFILSRTYFTKEGRKMNEYHFNGK